MFRQFWEDNMLEKHFFGTQIAGEKIFTNIDKLIEKYKWLIFMERTQISNKKKGKENEEI